MSPMSTSLSHPAHQRRLRSVVKRLVIELAHLETCLDGGVQDARVIAAADGLDGAIDGLNAYLAAGNARAA
jgi:hypothetical protein